MSHAYLFLGPTGVGKTTLARAFAKALLCLEATGEACGHCRSCSLFDSGNHPDLIPVGIDGESLKIEQIRELQRTLGFHPVLSRRKVVFLPYMEKMTEVAANGFLKTLEEPPAAVHFLGAAVDESVVLPTIRSRMQLVRLTYVPAEEIAQGLIQRGCPPEQAGTIASGSQGLPGLAIRRFQEAEAATRDWAALLEEAELLPLLRKAAEAEKVPREQVGQWLDEMAAYYRGRLAVGGRETAKKTLVILEAIQTARNRLAFNVNARLLLEGVFCAFAIKYPGK